MAAAATREGAAEAVGDMRGVPDVTQLTHLSEATVIGNLRERFEHDEIHTFTGNILLVLNPYTRLPIYDTPCMELFKGGRINRAPPHVYAIAEEAYRRLRKEGAPQTIVVSGESGAGKTESNKYLMRYLMWRSRSAGSSDGLADAILQSNPILEAFGNAKTGRNHNSSRFGKFVKLHVSASGGVEGAAIQTYLLEKTRVALHGDGERSYHIFYQLLAGADAAERARLSLGANSPAAFHYLRQGRVLAVPGMDDASEYAATRTAMDHVQIAPHVQRQVVGLVGALLHLGSVEFAHGDDDDVSAVRDRAALEPVNALLGVADMSPLLLHRRMRVPGAEFTLQLTAHQSAGARDAFARAFYDLLFRWLTHAINIVLVESVEQADLEAPFVGLLDVYGFEVFATNSFEQLCINCANEKLHQFFLAYVFKMEAALYEEECVPAAHIAYVDNQPCIDLLERPPSGILRLLDSQCITPQASDAKFCAHVNAEHARSPFLAPARTADMRRPEPSLVFVVRHYAGEVAYTASGFLQKNNDALDPHFREAMGESSVPLLLELLALADGGAHGAGGARGARRKGAGGAAFNSVGKRFLSEMAALLALLGTSGAHFVRCMKPNTAFKQRLVEPDVLLRQLHANGTLEAVRLMRHGFPIRVPFELLHSRYLPLLAHDVPAVRTLTPAQFCELIAAVVGVAPRDFVCGTTRIFLRGDAGAAFDELRDKEPAEVLPVLKAKMVEWEAKAAAIDRLRPWLVMWAYRCRYVRWRKAAIRVQARYRGGAARQQAHIRMLHAAAERAKQREERRAMRRSQHRSSQLFANGARGGTSLVLPAGAAPPRLARAASNASNASAETDPGPIELRRDEQRDSELSDSSVNSHFTERSEMEATIANGPRLTEVDDDDDDDDGGGGGGGVARGSGGGVEHGLAVDGAGAAGAGVGASSACARPMPLLPPLSLPAQRAVQRALAGKDYTMMEQEMRSLISKMRAEAALKEAQLLTEMREHMQSQKLRTSARELRRSASDARRASMASSGGSRRASNAFRASSGGAGGAGGAAPWRQHATSGRTIGGMLGATALIAKLTGGRSSRASHQPPRESEPDNGGDGDSDEEANESDDEPVKRAILRPTRAAHGAAGAQAGGTDGARELVIVEEGQALPLFRKVLSAQQIARARAIFDKWDVDRDGVVLLSEFLCVMQEVGARQGKRTQPRKVEAMFHIADIDGDGQINFEEFLVMQARRATRQRGESADHIPTGRKSSSSSRRSSSLGGRRGSRKPSIAASRRASVPRDGAPDARAPPAFGELLLSYYREDEPGGSGIVDEDTLRWLLARCHEELRAEPIKEARQRALLTLADPEQTGNVDLAAFGRIEAVHAYFTPRAPLPRPQRDTAEAAAATDRPPNPPPLGADFRATATTLLARAPGVETGGEGEDDLPAAERETPPASPAPAAHPDASHEQRAALAGGKIPLPGSDVPPQFNPAAPSRRQPAPSKELSAARPAGGKPQRPPTAPAPPSGSASAEAGAREGGARHTASFSRRGGGAAERGLSGGGAQQDAADVAARSSSARAERARTAAPQARPVSTAAARPASGARGETRAHSAAQPPSTDPAMERKRSFLRLGLPKLSFGRRAAR
ncbi:hypothetical protein KFE25_009940 [Diacronema lutheri]|uniref:Calmodulin n=1 Tax=Diacronema lutheri TaxID=2081491 RepID=A0A8J6C7K2_DIALT|nr:hypothetical protein KFE25_009940 [Diacronema lutheri]